MQVCELASWQCKFCNFTLGLKHMLMLRRATIRHGEQIRWGPILEGPLEAACMG